MMAYRNKFVQCGRLTASAATIKEARAEMKAKVDAALQGSYHPTLIPFGDYAVIIYRSPEGWQYKVIDPASMGRETPEELHACVLPTPTYDECYRLAAHHVVDLSNDGERFRFDADLPSWLSDSTSRRQILSKARFLRAYNHAAANQHADAHAWACLHKYESRFDP